MTLFEKIIYNNETINDEYIVPNGIIYKEVKTISDVFKKRKKEIIITFKGDEKNGK